VNAAAHCRAMRRRRREATRRDTSPLLGRLRLRSTLIGRRKLVTGLFCDVAETTSMAGRLGADVVVR